MTKDLEWKVFELLSFQFTKYFFTLKSVYCNLKFDEHAFYYIVFFSCLHSSRAKVNEWQLELDNHSGHTISTWCPKKVLFGNVVQFPFQEFEQSKYGYFGVISTSTVVEKSPTNLGSFSKPGTGFKSAETRRFQNTPYM